MKHRSSMAAIALVTFLATAIPALRATAAPGEAVMSKHDREVIAAAIANGETTVTFLVAAHEGASETVAAGLRGLGAEVRYREDDLSYLRTEIPIANAERIAGLSGVQAVEVDEVIAIDDPRPGGTQDPAPQPAPGAGTPKDNSYMPIRDTGAAQFLADHPSWDGRNVTVGIVDSGVDLAHPALQTTSTGARKIVDWVTATHPVDDDDPTWIAMTAAVHGPTFTVAGQTYTAPSNAKFRFGTIDERDPRLGGEIGNDLNRDGNPAGSSGLFGVLWDGGMHVWVDTDQDLRFTDEPAMREYKNSHHVGRFGLDDPATAVVEEMPFVVQIDSQLDYVNIGIVSGQHGSHVAGIVAANAMFGGAMSGAAPGAKLVSVRACLFVAGCTAHALVEGMIYAAKNANVDVINMSIGGLPALNDANNARAVLYNRLIDKFNVQMFISAGNSGPGMNTVGDPSVATDVLSVGSYISSETWLSNYGSTVSPADNLHPFSSRGPREDGGFKPEIIAPGAAVSTIPLWQPGGPVPGTYLLPPGYAMLNGTSMASPQAAGVGALLVSAAKQSGFPSRPDQIRQALTSSARFLAGYGAYEQGNGLINIGAAYALLRTNIRTVDISSSVPVDTLLAEFLATPGIGVGIHDREGVTVGVDYTRTYTFQRDTGQRKAITYQLTWVGNDGTFTSPATVALPKGVPVTLPVTINPATPGAHSAILNLDDPSTVGIDYQTLNTVVAPYEFNPANGFHHAFSAAVGRNQKQNYFFRVPAGGPAFTVDLSGPSEAPGTGQARFIRNHPYGVPLDDNSSLSCYSPPVVECTTGSPLSRTTANAISGVWEITVDARRTSDALTVPYTLEAAILGASVTPNPDIIPTATAGVGIPRSYTLTNDFGPFTGRGAGSTFGSAVLARPTIATAEQQLREVQVTPGTTSLRATIGNPSDPGADVDLFVFDCTSGSCELADQAADGDSEESVTISNPTAGTWRVLVDGFAIPSGSTDYDYIDVFTNPEFGDVTVTDANQLRAPGASWTVPGVVTALGAPTSGRVLLGQVQVRTESEVLIGSGDVIVESVTP